MSGGHLLLILVVVLWMVLQYGLVVIALRDLSKQRQVRGGNPITWWLIVLAVPVLGALAYLMIGTGRPIPLIPSRRPPGSVESDKAATS